MKRLFYPILLIVISLITLNCQKELSGDLNPGNNTTAPVTATVQGKIVDENGQPAAGVTVKAGTKTAVTDPKGYFRITKASLDKNASVVVAEKPGYFKAYRSFQATTGANHVSIKLVKKVLAGTVNSTTGGDAVLTNGSKITLPADAVMKAAGGTYSGSINIYSAYIDPTAADIAMTIPGSLMADDKNGKRVTLNSFGMLAVELESGTGEKLQIATGKTATLTTAIPSSLSATAPSTIALWYVDEQTGIWKEEGTAVKNGNNYVGEVKHFSFWNCDISIPSVTLTMTLKTPAGIPLIHVAVRLTRPNGASSYGWTDSLGTVSGLVPANEVLQMSVLDDCWNPVFTQPIGPFSSNTNLGVITATPIASSFYTISGTALNCTGGPVSNGYAIVVLDFPRYVPTNASGQFTLGFLHCAASPTIFDVTAIDETAQQQGSVTGIAITGPVTNVGNIIACGTSTVEFINYTYDGINYSLSSTVASDSIYGSSYQQGATPWTTSISGSNIITNKSIHFSFQSPATVAGTYTITIVTAQGVAGSTILSPSTVTLTVFPAVAGFYEGSFSTTFKDAANVTHTLNGTFRVRRH